MAWIQSWYASNATVGTLLFLMAIDVLSGTALAAVERKINSSANTKGMLRKSVTMLLVLTAAALERFVGNAPIAEAVAIGFCLSETMSIVENANRLGIPVPAPIKRVMSVLAEQTKDHTNRPNLIDQAIDSIDGKDGHA